MPFGGLLTEGLIGIGSSIGNGIIGGNAAKNATNAQIAGEQQVQDLVKSITGQANDTIGRGVTGANDILSNTYGRDLGLLQPYTATGTNALGQLNALVNGGGFQAPTGVTEQNDPGYQFRMQQGQQALERSAAARGGALGGAAGKELEQYGQGFGSNEYGNVYNRALQGYQTNFGNLNTLAGLGLNATNTGVGASNVTGTQQAGNTFQGGALQADNLLKGLGISADAITGAANARASGYVGQANAQQGMLSAASGGGMGMLGQLQQLLTDQAKKKDNSGDGSDQSGVPAYNPY